MRFRPANLGTLTGGILAVAVLLLFAPVATASCGDYVHIATQGEPAPPPPPCSCEHGQCHAPPALPPVSEPTTTETQSSVDAALLDVTSANPSRSTRRPPDVDGVPSHTSSGVFHPPRG